MRLIRTALVTLLISASIATASAQEPPSKEPARTPPQVVQALQAYEGQLVASIEIAGRPDVSTNELQSLLAQKAGEPFSRAKVEQSVAALKATGKSQDVQLQVLPTLEGVRLLIVLQPGLYFGIYNFTGALRFPYSRLLQVANYPPEGPYSETDVINARDALLHFFQRAGFFQAKVAPRIQSDPDRGIVNVDFVTELGRRANFGEVTIQGTTPEQTAELQSKLKSMKARLRGAAIRPGKAFNPRTLRNATQYLQNALAKDDRLNAQVKLVGANYDAETNRADIVFQVQPGPIVRVKVEGARLWSSTRKKLIPIYQQIGVDQELILEGRENLVSHFQSKGYFNAKVDVSVQQVPGGESILYKISKGPRHKVDELHIAGNQSIDSAELMPHVPVRKASFLKRGKYSESLVRTSVKNLKAVYHAAGFSQVDVQPEIQNKGGDIDITFRVSEGPRDTVEAIEIKGNRTVPVSQLAPKGLKVVPDQPYSQKLVDEDRTQITSRYLQLGYLTSTFRATAKPMANDPHRLKVVYEIYEGPRVVANSVVTLGREVTRQSFVDRSIQTAARKPLTETDMLLTESQLYNARIFDWAEVDPRRKITTQNDEDVLVKVHEAKRNSITYGFGFEVINRGGSVPGGTVAVPGIPPIGLPNDFKTSEKTFWGPRGTIEYTRRNVRGNGETITLTGFGGRLRQNGTFTYQNPYFKSTNWASNLAVSGEHNSENPIFTSNQWLAGFQLQRALNPDKTRNLFLRYSYSHTILSDLLIPELVPEEDRNVRLSTISASHIRDTRDKVLDASRGIYESIQLDLNPKPLGSSVGFTRLLAQTAYYKRIAAGVIWANSLRLGFELPIGDSHIPLSEKFFTGGGSTLRGFPLNGAGPQRTITACGDPNDPSTCSPITVPVGGNQLAIFNSEFRFPGVLPVPLVPNKLGVVAFYDGGNVFPAIGFHGQWTNTIGIGFRYSTPVGPVRFDIGHNLNAPPGIKTTQFFITLGQSF